MKKTILSLAVLFATTFSFSALAQTPAAAACPAGGEKTECCDNLLFEGIILTPEQQSQIEALKASCNAKAKEAKDAKKADRQAGADAKKAAKKERLNSLKAILTPEQYVIFLENSFVNAPARNGGHKIDGARRDFKAKGGDRTKANGGKKFDRKGDKAAAPKAEKK